MAQLDKYTFFDQSFLVFSFFLFLYIFHARFLLPYIASNLKVRTKLLTCIMDENSFYNDISASVFYNNNKTLNYLLHFTHTKLNIINNYLLLCVKSKKF